MTPLHQAAHMALDALIYHRDQTRPIERSDAAITALREALAAPEPEPVARVAEVHMSRYTIEWTNGPLPEGTGLYAAPPAAPEPEPVAWLVEGWHDGKLIAHIPHLTLEDAKASAAVFSQHYTTTKLVHLYAAPPAAPAPDGWVMVPRGLLRRLIAEALTFDPILQDKEAIEQAKQLAASPAAPAAPVVPLTDELIDYLWRLPMSADWEHREFARAIEAAHGITGGSNAT